MNIGSIFLDCNLILAPMAGVTDRAFRQICREHGAGLTVSEMVSTRALTHGDKKSEQLLRLAENEKPSSVQIFGHEPESMARGAFIAQEISGCDIIDINMGCPAPKIVGNGDGSALMRDPLLAGRIIEAVCGAVSVPVTVKFRLGWDASTRNYLEFAYICEQSGAQMLCVHGRTRAQQYSGQADWDAIAQIRAASRVPIVANGDVFTAQDAENILARTKADGVMIGRGALGDPWLFEQADAQLNGLPLPPLPTPRERVETAVRQIEMTAADKGERVALLEARKQVNWYLKGVSGVKDFKIRVTQLCKLEELYALANDLYAFFEGDNDFPS